MTENLFFSSYRRPLGSAAPPISLSFPRWWTLRPRRGCLFFPVSELNWRFSHSPRSHRVSGRIRLSGVECVHSYLPQIYLNLVFLPVVGQRYEIVRR